MSSTGNRPRAPRQDQLDDLIAFLEVAENRGFSAAAARMGMSPSAVSQAIRNLEARLGTSLFARTTRSVNLTAAGARYLERVRPAVIEIGEAFDELGDMPARPQGELRLTVSRAGFLFVLRPLLARFAAAYPEIALELSVDSALVDIVRSGFDAGIRYSDTVERDMTAVPVGPPQQSYVVAAPAYLARRGPPAQPRDLLRHECIRYRYRSSGRIARWVLERGRQRLELAVNGRLVLDDDAAMVEAALLGLGVAYLTSGYAEPHLASGHLVRVLPEWSPAMPGLALYYPSRRRVSPRLRALIDFLRDDGPKTPRRGRPRRGRRAARS